MPPVLSQLRTTAALLTVCAAAAAACSDPTTGPNQDLQVTTSGPVRFSVGELTSITVTVTNNSTSRTYQISPYACEDPFTVTSAGGTTFAPASRNCTLPAYSPKALPPGQSLALTRNWVGDVGIAGNNGIGTLLSPGTYTVRGFVRVVTGPSTDATVASNAPLTTEILAQ